MISLAISCVSNVLSGFEITDCYFLFTCMLVTWSMPPVGGQGRWTLLAGSPYKAVEVVPYTRVPGLESSPLPPIQHESLCTLDPGILVSESEFSSTHHFDFIHCQCTGWALTSWKPALSFTS